MIKNDVNSELQIRLHIAEMLKGKVEQDNYEALCTKVLTFIMNGIELPKVKESPSDKLIEMMTKIPFAGTMNKDSFEKMIKEIEVDSLPESKELKLARIADANMGKLIHWKGSCCYICGYSTEFDCLIVGTFEIRGNADTLGATDTILCDKKKYQSYFYVPLDEIS